MKASINIESIVDISSNIEIKKDEIFLEYKNVILPMLNNSRECYEECGYNLDEEINDLNKKFDDLNERFNMLIKILGKDVVNQYTQLNENIISSFNNDFKNEFNELISNQEE